MEKKKVLVTGASKGIGKAICSRLLADGYSVVGIARNAPDEIPHGMDFYSVDLSDSKAVVEFLDEFKTKESFYGLVNNVGMVPSNKLEHVELSDLHKAVQLNIEVAIIFTQALLPGMRSNRIGRILNISSRAALGKESRTIYSMTKAGIIGMTRTWALELAKQGITVNSIAPGPIGTEFFESVNNSNDEKTQSLLASIPVGRLGQPQDVAHAAAYFLDERCGFVTGQTHFVCGGITIGAA